MKTIKNLIPILILSLLLLSDNIYAHNEKQLISQTEESIALNEEAYVEDIPFDTSVIAAAATYKKEMEKVFALEEEAYIDDIPFETHTTACFEEDKTAIPEHFPLEEEQYINDIPFNTALIVAVIKAQSNLLAQRR